MRIRKVLRDEDLQLFQTQFERVFKARSGGIGGGIPLEYLQRSEVYAMFNKKNEMLAGYVFGASRPYRLLEFVPENERSHLKAPFNRSWSECCEITCAWKLKSVSRFWMCAYFWPHVFVQIIQSGKSAVIGHNQNRNLDQFYTRGTHQSLYRGISTFGLDSHLFAYDTRKGLVSMIWIMISRCFPRSLQKFLRGRRI